MKNKSNMYLYVAGIMIVFMIVSLFYKNNVNDKTGNKINEETSLFSVQEIQCDKEIDNLSFIDLKPCIVSDGKAYIYDNNEWNVVECDNDITRIYNGDTFCALDSEGNIIIIEENPGDYEAFPLTTAGVYYNAEKILKYTEKEKVLLLGGNPLKSEYCIAYFDDGSTKMFINGQMVELSDSLNVVDISGGFILDESGNVYKVSNSENLSNISLKQISEKRYVSISACASADRCIGICEDGSVTVWSDVDLKFTFNAGNAKSAAMGFNYGVVLCDDGKIEFHSSNDKLEKQLSEYFDNLNEKASAIACNYDCILVKLENGACLKILCAVHA